MFGFKFIKFQPTDYVLCYKNGRVAREGAGLSFFYYAPRTSLVAVPVGSAEAPFIFEEQTADYQAVTIQGTVTYKIAQPRKTAAFLNFTLDPGGRGHVSDDPKKLPQRLVNTVLVLAKKEIQKLPLRQALRATDALVQQIGSGLQANAEIEALGLQVLGLAILAIKPSKETARALEAEAREQILKEADDAIYLRRNAAVEQERKIKENELSTEIAVENKKRQIREAQMEAERVVQEKKHGLEQAEMTFKIGQEEEKKKLVGIAVQNARQEADASAYAISATMGAFQKIDPGIVQAVASAGMNPQQLIASAFLGLADKAGKIGQLNISPDLLQELLRKNPE
jgi:hypothetical protein